MLKPQLNLKYNLLTESTGNQVINGISPNDYTWGASFQMPLFIRKERGDLELARIKIQETELDLKQKQAHIQFKANAALNDWQNTVDQFDLYTETVTNYFDLLQGERQLFLGGESSLFMVNSREMSYIQASIKLAEIAAKNRKAKLMTDYILGILNQAL
jgi:outer membrane protein TolC